MLSVIVYGRNDSHGYNPHKRAALSLNGIAHLMDDADDEIVFVDYNTPDNLPTFIEAIQDTLTEAARRRLRILRVRPTVHDRLRGRTHLQAVESIARNIGARRSNPANRWLLSSNTDMIFVPHQAGRTLSAIAAELEDGFYCLPRFELPENFWELLNRTDPADAIARVGQWGTRFHLNDIVYGGEDILYDAPGDFQLMLRQDLFDIGGFDERMILGWHVDSNISRRLRLLRGAVRGAVDHLYGYHCDHTRQVTLLHGHDRVEDDWKRFVEDVDSPHLPEQHDSWGLAGEEVEEFTLARSQGAVYVQALSELLEPMPVRARESVHCDEGFHDLTYSPEHVLPYLCDVLSGMPRHWDLAYLGCRPRVYALVRAAWEKLGFTGTILRPEGFEHLGDGPVLPAGEVYARTTLVLAEFGYASADAPAGAPESRPGAWSEADTARLTRTRMVFEEFLRAEAARPVPPGEAPRYFVTVNAIYNIFEDTVLSNLSVTYTPYSSRVRHGYLLRARLPAPLLERRGMGRWLQGRLGRQAPVPFNELSHLLRLATSLLRDGRVPDDHPPSATALLAVPLLALLDHPDLPELAGAAPERIAALRADIAARRPSRTLRDRIRLPVSDDARPAGASRMAGIEAWEDPDWRAWAHRHFGGANAYNYFDRGAWTWERIHILHTLDRLGALGADKAVLVVAGGPDALYAVLTQHAGRVDVANPGAPPEDAETAALWTRPIELLLPERLRVVHRALTDGAGLGTDYDAVVFVGDSLFGGGPAAAVPLLAWAEARLRTGGTLAFSGRVLLDGERPEHWLDGRRVAAGEPVRLLAAQTGLEPTGAFDPVLSAATLDRLDDPAAGWIHHGHFVARDGDALFATGLWFLAKRRPTDPDGWRALADAFERTAYGDITASMRPGDGLARTGEGVEVDAAAPGGLVLFGPYTRLTAGRYRLTLDVAVDDAVLPHRPLLTVQVVADGEAVPLAWWDLVAADLTEGGASLVFEVPEALASLGGRGARLEFPVTHFGGTGLRIRAVRLSPAPADAPLPPALRLRPLARMVPASVAEPEPPGVAVGPQAAAADLLYGPNLRLPAGRYRLSIAVELRGPADSGRAVLSVAVLAGGAPPAPWRDVRVEELADGVARIVFDVPPALAMTAPGGGAPYEFRVAHLGGLALAVTDLRLERLPDDAPDDADPALSLDVLARMPAAAGIARDGFAAIAPAGEAGLMLFGPYLKLPAGRYRLSLDASADGSTGHRPALGLEVAAGGPPLLLKDFTADALAAGPVTIDFAVPPELAASADDGGAPFEFRISHLGPPLTVRGLRLDRLPGTDDAYPPATLVDLALLPRLTKAAIGTRVDGAVCTAAGEPVGHLLFGPYLKLPEGGYRLTLTAAAEGAPAEQPALGVEIAAGGPPFLLRDLTAGGLAAGPVVLDFVVSPELAASADGGGAPFEFRIVHLGVPLTVHDLRLLRLPAAADARPPAAAVDIALLPRLSKTDIGERVGGTVQVGVKETPGALLFGPYLKLPAGRYGVSVTATAKAGLLDWNKPVLAAEVVAGGTALVPAVPVTAGTLNKAPLPLEFAVTAEQAAAEVEVVLTHTGKGSLTIRDVHLRWLGPA